MNQTKQNTQNKRRNLFFAVDVISVEILESIECVKSDRLFKRVQKLCVGKTDKTSTIV